MNMATSGVPRNRKERRAAGLKGSVTKSSDIPLSQPSRETPKTKTLFEIAAERQSQLQHGEPFGDVDADPSSPPAISTTQINPDGTLTEISAGEDSQFTGDPIGPFGQALFFTLTLSMLHFTLDVLVHHQYRQEIGWDLIIQRTLITLPLLLALLYMLHSRSTSLWAQSLFLCLSVGAGCYLIYSSNELAYFAVMKRAPPVGTLWVWSVIEMRLPFALGSLITVALYFWWGDYTIF